MMPAEPRLQKKVWPRRFMTEMALLTTARVAKASPPPPPAAFLTTRPDDDVHPKFKLANGRPTDTAHPAQSREANATANFIATALEAGRLSGSARAGTEEGMPKREAEEERERERDRERERERKRVVEEYRALLHRAATAFVERAARLAPAQLRRSARLGRYSATSRQVRRARLRRHRPASRRVRHARSGPQLGAAHDLAAATPLHGE